MIMTTTVVHVQVYLDLQVQLENQVQMGTPDFLALSEFKDLKDHLAPEEPKVSMEAMSDLVELEEDPRLLNLLEVMVMQRL